MDEQQLQQTASQLRRPHGEDGIKIAEFMNKGNRTINLNTISVLNPEPHDNILEIGMGNGFFVPEIVSKHPGIHYTGCDFSELMVEESEKLNSEWTAKGQAKFVLSDIASLPFDNNSFTKIFTINTIYFWDDVSIVLNGIKRILKSEGKFIVGLRPKHQAEKYPFIKYGFKLFSKEDIATLFEENGLTVSQIIEQREPDFDMNGEIMTMEHLIVVGQKN
ncbi:MAG: class I SAM-dependent methyltransferase [Ignavibacteriae bacterium]|nr:class I SAM-dependent methyltransferase [Ignavibacteriota bacterium]